MQINVDPRFLIVGLDRETAAEKLIASITPDSAANVSVFSGRLSLIVESTLPVASHFYVAAAPSQLAALVIANLEWRPAGKSSGRTLGTRPACPIGPITTSPPVGPTLAQSSAGKSRRMATLAERLAEAEDALHRLQTGTALVRVRSQAGELVEYAQPDLGRLSAYIGSLRRQASGRSAKRTFNPVPGKGL